MTVPVPRGPDLLSCELARRDAIQVWGEYSPVLLFEMACLSLLVLHRFMSPGQFWNRN